MTANYLPKQAGGSVIERGLVIESDLAGSLLAESEILLGRARYD